MKYFLGFDVGTNSSKGTLIDESGTVLYSITVEHEFENPRPGYFEQDAETVWWGDVCKLSQQIIANAVQDPKKIAGVGISALGCDVVPVDRDCMPLRKAILYGIDSRGMEVVSDLERHYGKEYLERNMHRSFVSSDCVPKILWLKKNEPEIWKKAAHFLTASSFLTAKLTDEYVIDYFLISCFEPLYKKNGEIRSEEETGFVCRPDQLARPAKTTDIVGYITDKASIATGIPTGVPVVTGTDDSGAEAISSGVVSTGDFMIQLGSTAFMIYCTDKMVHIPMLSGSPYLVPGKYSVDGGTNTAGNLTKWIRDTMYPDLVQAEKAGGENAYKVLAEKGAGIAPGSDGVLVLPYFAGERVPINDPYAKGVIFGLLMNHTRDHIYRAALEAVAYSIDQFIALLKEHHQPLDTLICTGGGAKNDTWLQIIADVTGYPVQVPKYSIGASYGDALIAAIGVGAVADFSQLKDLIKTGRDFLPDSAVSEIYSVRKEQFYQLYQNNINLMHLL